MILYHISPDFNNIIKEFNARIPKKDIMCINEDNITPRICVSDSICGAFSAMPAIPQKDKPFRKDIKNNMFRVYEFDSKDLNIIDYKTLYETNKVIDSLATKEYWILNKKVKPINSYLIKVDSYSYDLIPILSKEYWTGYFELAKTNPDYQDQYVCDNNGFLFNAYISVTYKCIFEENTYISVSNNYIYEYFNYDKEEEII